MRMVLTALALLCTTAANANEAQAPEPVVPAPALSAIGQVNVAHYNRRTTCTGTLIAPDLVITAAECVVDPTTRTPVSGQKIHFLAGVDKDKHLAHAQIQCVKFAEGYVYQGPERHQPHVPQKVPASAFARSIAVLVLDHKLDIAPLQLAQAEASGFPANQPLIQAGYSVTQRYKIATRSCTFAKHPAGVNLWTGTCDRAAPSHGAPILARTGSALSIVGITPSSFDFNRPLGLGLEPSQQLLNTQCPRGEVLPLAATPSIDCSLGV